MENIIYYLKLNYKKYGNKIAIQEVNNKITYKDLYAKVKIFSSAINNFNNEPILLFMPKSIDLSIAMLGVTLSGNYYSIVDSNTPVERINTIINILMPKVIIGYENDINKITTNVKKINFNQIMNSKEKYINKNIISTNPMYVLFTSGSTGIPKGVVVSHKAVISYLYWFTNCFKIDSKTIFGSQTPFYFSMSVSDFLGSIYTGAKIILIPKSYFSFPIKLLDCMNKFKINTIYWVPSALAIPYYFDALKEFKLPYLNKILFAGEVMPPKLIRYYQDHLQNVFYANLFGPTETTDICTYYKIKNKVNINKSIPIGKVCEGLEALIIKDNKLSDEGELCIKGSFLATGYINNKDKTTEVFIQNPLNNKYPDVVYKTGDIVKYDNDGNLIYLSRKDFQIKRHGYRIELSEIEANIINIKNIKNCICIYLEPNIFLFYNGNVSEIDLRRNIVKLLPSYMMPDKIIKIDKIVYNMNGKIDRNYYKELAKEKYNGQIR
jgi:D-alanine--poly(phosphoribitol) ligase subunit 1